MNDKYSFKCEKCGNETYLEAENDYEKVLICEKCAECYVVEQKQIRPQQNIPHCPTCISTNIKKISTTSKAVNVALFGLLGNKRKKQFHCNNCGYEW